MKPSAISQAWAVAAGVGAACAAAYIWIGPPVIGRQFPPAPVACLLGILAAMFLGRAGFISFAAAYTLLAAGVNLFHHDTPHHPWPEAMFVLVAVAVGGLWPSEVRRAATRAVRASQAAARGAEKRVGESNKVITAALGASGAALWTIDRAAAIHHRDARLNAMLGLEATDADAPAAAMDALIHPDDATAVAEARAGARDDATWSVIYRLRRHDGQMRRFREYGFADPVAPDTLTVATADITEETRWEDPALPFAAADLTERRTLAGDALRAHRNMLQLLLGLAELPDGPAPGDEPLVPYINVLRAVRHCKPLTSHTVAQAVAGSLPAAAVRPNVLLEGDPPALAPWQADAFAIVLAELLLTHADAAAGAMELHVAAEDGAVTAVLETAFGDAWRAALSQPDGLTLCTTLASRTLNGTLTLERCPGLGALAKLRFAVDVAGAAYAPKPAQTATHAEDA